MGHDGSAAIVVFFKNRQCGRRSDLGESLLVCYIAASVGSANKYGIRLIPTFDSQGEGFGNLSASDSSSIRRSLSFTPLLTIMTDLEMTVNL